MDSGTLWSYLLTWILYLILFVPRDLDVLISVSFVSLIVTIQKHNQWHVEIEVLKASTSRKNMEKQCSPNLQQALAQEFWDHTDDTRGDHIGGKGSCKDLGSGTVAGSAVMDGFLWCTIRSDPFLLFRKVWRSSFQKEIKSPGYDLESIKYVT